MKIKLTADSLHLHTADREYIEAQKRLIVDLQTRLAEREKEIERLTKALEHIAFGSLEKTFHEITEMTDQQIAQAALGEQRHLERRDEGDGA